MPFDSKRCGAKSRRTGKPCTQWAMRGATRCKQHGGKSPQSQQRAVRERVVAKAAATLGRLKVEPVENPLTELQALAGEAKAWRALMARHVADLTTTRHLDDKGGEQIRGEVQLFERAMDRCGSLLVSIARLNVDERLARVSERQTELVADALAATLQEMGLSHDQQREARRGVARHLRPVAG